MLISNEDLIPKFEHLKDVKFPPYFEKTLANGIKLFIVEDSEFPLVTTRFVFKTGAFFDTGFKSGVAHLVSKLLTQGTKKLSATELSEQIDYYGAVVSTGCGYDATYIYSNCMKKYLNEVFELVSDIVWQPAFEQSELDRKKYQLLNFIISEFDEADYLAERLFKKSVYKNTPYSFDVKGNEDSVNSITRNDIVNFYEKYYKPDNLILAVVGDITVGEVEELITSKFIEVPSIGEVRKQTVSLSKEQGINIYLVEKKGAVQSEIQMGHIGVTRDNPDYIKIYVMNMILGGYFTSRINRNLREIHGYTYGARSSFSYYKWAGDFCVETNVKTEQTRAAVEEVLKEINKMRANFVKEEELETVKNYVTGNFPLQFETANAIATHIINLEFYELEKNYYDTFISKVNSVSREDVLEVANKYLDSDNISICISGEVDKLVKDFESLGTIKVITNIKDLQ
ncbi:MAG: M16 family metallopeptidase [Ignavibacteria bacterium]